MTHPELTKLMKELDEWCGAERGRQALVSKEIQASEGLVHDWRNGRRIPNIEQYFALREFLKKQRRRISRA
jgi:hypothetical protein